MKKIFFMFLVMLLFPEISNADWYTFDIENRVLWRTKEKPDSALLERHNWIAVYTDENIPVDEVEYRAGKAIRHVKTQKEIQAEQDKKNLIESIKAKLRELGFTNEQIELFYLQ